MERDRAVDRTERARPLEIGGRAAHADDRVHDTGAAQRQRERAADQPDADDDQLVDLHPPSAVDSAASKRSFSVGSPTVMRSHCGSP